MRGGEGPIPCDAAICRIKHVLQASAQVFLDDDPSSPRPQDRFAHFQVLDNLLVGEMAQTPLRPYNVILGALHGLPVLQPHVEDVSHAFCALERLGKPRNRLHHVDFLRDGEK